MEVVGLILRSYNNEIRKYHKASMNEANGAWKLACGATDMLYTSTVIKICHPPVLVKPSKICGNCWRSLKVEITV